MKPAQNASIKRPAATLRSSSLPVLSPEELFMENILYIKNKIRNKFRFECKPPITVAETDTWPRCWITEMRLLHDVLMVSIKTENDSVKYVATALPDYIIAAIKAELQSQTVTP